MWFLFKPKQDGTGWEWVKKSILVPIHSTPTRNREFHKNSKINSKNSKNHYGFFSSQNGTGKAENERKKNIIVPIHSNTTRNREFQKIAKKFKRLKNSIMASFEGKTRRDRLRMREKKNCSCQFQANPKYRILKI